MNKTAIASLVGLLFSPSIFAATDIQTDDVVVTASRVAQPIESAIADITVINQQEIARAGQSTLVELLQSQSGIEISNNGGAGKISGVFLRGTNSSHVVVLIDGMRINSATTGTTSFENIPLAQIERIEILRGPASSLYGQDAIGGVIQIFTKKGEGKPSFYASAGYGSYNTKSAEAGFRGSSGDTSYAFNVSSYDTRGFSAYKTKDPNFKDDDGYRNLAFTASVNHKLAEGHEIGVQFFQSEGHTNFDNRFNVFSPTPDFSDNANISQLSYAVTSRNQFSANWLSTLRLGEGIDESENFQVFGRSLFKTRQRQYSWQNDINLPLGTLTLLYDRLEQRVSSTTVYDKSARDNDGFVGSYLLNLGAHSFQASYRSDHNSQFGNNNTGGIGYGYSFNQNWRISGNYGTAFKAPTFNDLYFPGFSNPNLKPEKSRNLEASLRYETQTSSASLTLYENRIRDLIALDFLNFPFVFNLNNARIQGLTLAGAQRWDSWQLKGNVDLQSPRDEDTNQLLVRRANRHASANLSREWGDWRFATEVIASSARYNDTANTQRLAGYGLVNLTADYKINQDWNVQARVNNLFDKDYALAFDGDPKAGGFVYNTPGSNLFVSVRYSPSR
jgi:vitamin B12 transporter